ncbi:MAG: response regulator [Calditrichaeota bacterium]|nr:MAG: response regulator [Calditrichota bacterium]MBL1205520.1 response regulator [Calditrichota bacterium]NOG45348.1 response regulator [Calditrichota bacterium]
MQSRKTILVIDDDLSTLNLLKSILTKAGYNVVVDSIPQRAFNYLEENNVDLILLDILMPRMDGYQLCSILKEKPNYKNIPVIFLTALADQNSISKSFAVGAVDYISKPYETEELLSRINVYLQMSNDNAAPNIQTRNPLICSTCNKIWDNKYWFELADFLRQHSNVTVNSSICPSCKSKSLPSDQKTDKSFFNDESNRKQSEILIIDDHPDNIQLLGQILVKNNFKVHSAESGKKVLGFIEERQPDLILLDIMMPEMDGYEVCKELKSNSLTKHIPVIFLTALADSDAIIKGFEVGANDFITKPFHINEVIARVQAQLNFKQLMQVINQQESSLSICEQCNKIKLYKKEWITFEKMFNQYGSSILMYTVCPKCMEKKYL